MRHLTEKESVLVDIVLILASGAFWLLGTAGAKSYGPQWHALWWSIGFVLSIIPAARSAKNH